MRNIWQISLLFSLNFVFVDLNSDAAIFKRSKRNLSFIIDHYWQTQFFDWKEQFNGQMHILEMHGQKHILEINCERTEAHVLTWTDRSTSLDMHGQKHIWYKNFLLYHYFSSMRHAIPILIVAKPRYGSGECFKIKIIKIGLVLFKI